MASGSGPLQVLEDDSNQPCRPGLMRRSMRRPSSPPTELSCDLIQWEHKVPHLQNHTGGDMYIYPGFILYRASRQAFALIDFHDVSLKLVSTQFTEADTVPSDSQIIGHTWAKSNKDGTP